MQKLDREQVVVGQHHMPGYRRGADLAEAGAVRQHGDAVFRARVGLQIVGVRNPAALLE